MESNIKTAVINEEEAINASFKELLDIYLASQHRKKVELITKAFNFARQAHKGVRRHSGEPYIMHPLAVARIVCKEIGLGSTSICAALLHDVVEDTDYTVEDIRNLFGDKIAEKVSYVLYRVIRILYNIVQQGSAYGCGTEPNLLADNAGNFERVHDVRLAAVASDTFVCLPRKIEGFCYKLYLLAVLRCQIYVQQLLKCRIYCSFLIDSL